MQTTALHRLDVYARCGIPVILTLVLAVLGVVPLRAADFAVIAPGLVLPSIYFWAIYRPTMMPLYSVFLIGLFEDIITGAPAGIHTVSYLLIFGLVAAQRKVFLGKSFGVVWWGFMLVAAAMEALRWLLIVLLSVTPLDPLPGVFSYLSTIAIYPPLFLLLSLVHRILPQLDG